MNDSPPAATPQHHKEWSPRIITGEIAWVFRVLNSLVFSSIVVEGRSSKENTDFSLSRKDLLDPRKPGTLMALLLGHPMQMKCSVMRRGKLHVMGSAFLWPGSAMESGNARMGRTSSAVSSLPAVLCCVSCAHPHPVHSATCLFDSSGFHPLGKYSKTLGTLSCCRLLVGKARDVSSSVGNPAVQTCGGRFKMEKSSKNLAPHLQFRPKHLRQCYSNWNNTGIP